MKKLLSFIISIIALTMLTVIFTSAAEADKIYYVATQENEDAIVYTQTISKRTYLFLPSSADLTKLVLSASGEHESITISADSSVTATIGEEIDITALFDKEPLNGEYPVKVSLGDISFDVTIMHSENIKSLFIISENPAENGRKYIDKSKSNKAKGKIVYLDADGTLVNADEMTEIKARGNSTFTDFEKKPYQFKIKNKFNMTGDKSNAQKKWVLLANAGDVTLIHNTLVATLAKDLNIPYTIDCEPVDLYYDGEYRGSYLLTDKVEIGSTGVDIEDLDGLIEDTNEGTDAYENPVVVTKTTESKGEAAAEENSNGSYKYVDGLKEPALKEGTKHHAYLLELEFIYRYPDEQSGFVTSRGQAVVTKNPEYLTKDTGAYISQFYQEFEDAVFSPDGFNAKTGKYYFEYCDLDSLVKIYLINEFTKNYDSYRSSTFFYLPEDENIMYAGPTWDYDLCFTTGYDYNSQIAGNPENFWAATKYLASTLITISSFRDAVKDYLNSEDGEFYLAAAKMLGEDGNIMKFSQTVYASQRMNYKLWDIKNDETAAFRCGDKETYDNGIDFLLDYATKRLTWLSETTAKWNGDSYSAPMDPTKWEATSRYHVIQTVEGKASTCTEGGYAECDMCLGCNTIYAQRIKTAPNGHYWIKATCCTKQTCLDCGATDDTAVQPEHSWATASDGTKKCRICGTAEGEKHNYTYDMNNEQNAETKMVFTCSDCSNIYILSIAKRPVYEKGDVNKDGKLTAADARTALRISAKLDPYQSDTIKLADINNDGKLTAEDARSILRMAAKLPVN